MIEWSLGSAVLMITYSIIFIVNFYAVFIYRKAYLQMKKTRMIKSVYYLLLSLFFDNVYFFFAVLCKDLNANAFYILTIPLLWAIPKLVLLVGIMFFIYASLSPSDKKFCNHLEELKKKIKEDKKNGN